MRRFTPVRPFHCGNKRRLAPDDLPQRDTSCDAAGRLIEHFSNAGLPQPVLFCETPSEAGRCTSLCLVRGTGSDLLPRMSNWGS